LGLLLVLLKIGGLMGIGVIRINDKKKGMRTTFYLNDKKAFLFI
jgi:hypothetical protein